MNEKIADTAEDVISLMNSQAEQHFETHISHIFVCGDFAYKIKKPCKFDFLDFSTLKLRKHYCERELQLNTRYAPELYLAVVPIARDTSGKLELEGAGEVVEYAVKMAAFDSEALFSELLERGKVSEELLSELVTAIARFHEKAELQPEYFSYQSVTELLADNFTVCRQHLSQYEELPEQLQKTTLRKLETHRELIDKRQRTHVKQLHGDLHLGNICLYRGKATLFDGIEFGDSYSCCDTWADIGFLIMDLLHRQKKSLANLVLNTYLEQTGDYQGATLLPLYIVYRATVRAKVTSLRYAESPSLELLNEAKSYLELAEEALKEKSPLIFVVGGFSGSGKTTVSREISRLTGAVHLRSDVLRKQLLGLSLESAAPADSYSEERRQETYEELLRVAKTLLSAGYSIVIDSTNTSVSNYFSELGHLITLWCEAPDDVVKKRLALRVGDASDADYQVYQRQRESSQRPDWPVFNTNKSINQLKLEIKQKLSENNLLD